MRFWLSVFVFALLAVQSQAVYYDEPRAEVLQELGKPSSVLRRGGREILIYPNGGRIELENGKVAVVQGIEVREGPVAPLPDAGAAVAADAKAEAPGQKPDPAAQAEKEAAAERAKMQAEMEKAINDMESRKYGAEESPRSVWGVLLAKLLVKALMMLAALKLTTKYWDFNLEWSGLAIAAGADTGVRFLLSVIGEVVLKMPSLFYADEAIAAGVLVFVLRKVSHNKSLGRAVTITMTSKVFSIVVGSMVAVVVMNALFG